MENNEWVSNGWIVATKLLSKINDRIIPCVSKKPAFIFSDKFIIFYAFAILGDVKEEYWIITGDLPPSIIDAKEVNDERDAILQFGAIYNHDGQIIQENGGQDLMIPSVVIGERKADKAFGEYLSNIGQYLIKLGQTFPWEQYGVSGKVFSIE